MIYVGGILNREQRGHGRGSCFIHPCAVINGFWGSFFTIGELIFKATQNGLKFKKIFATQTKPVLSPHVVRHATSSSFVCILHSYKYTD